MVGDFVRDKMPYPHVRFCCDGRRSVMKIKACTVGWFSTTRIWVVPGRSGESGEKRCGGEQQIKYMMEQFQENPPHIIAGQKVIRVLDYKTSIGATCSTVKPNLFTNPSLMYRSFLPGKAPRYLSDHRVQDQRLSSTSA